jgi:hypothetical protein
MYTEEEDGVFFYGVATGKWQPATGDGVNLKAKT